MNIVSNYVQLNGRINSHLSVHLNACVALSAHQLCPGTLHGPMVGGLEKLCMLRFNDEKEDYKIMMMMMMMMMVVVVMMVMMVIDEGTYRLRSI